MFQTIMWFVVRAGCSSVQTNAVQLVLSHANICGATAAKYIRGANKRRMTRRGGWKREREGAKMSLKRQDRRPTVGDRKKVFRNLIVGDPLTGGYPCLHRAIKIIAVIIVYYVGASNSNTGRCHRRALT